MYVISCRIASAKYMPPVPSREEVPPKRQKVMDPTVSPDFMRETCTSVADKVKAIKLVVDGPAFIEAGGVELIGEWLSAAVAEQETGLVHACLGCLEKLPISMEILQKTKIGKSVNESLRTCTNQVAVDRARKLINSWKGAVNGGGLVAVAKKAPARPLPVPEPAKIEAPPTLPVAPAATAVPDSPEEDTAVSALASLLDSLPDLDALMAEEPAPVKRRIAWRSDTDLVQMVEFGITDTCLDLRRTIDETHGGLASSLHPHGEDTAEEHCRFRESRRKERAMGGKELRKNDIPDVEEEDMEPPTRPFYFPPRVAVAFADAVHSVKKLKSYERQDLADIHGARPEIVYIDSIPDTPGEPSTGSKFVASLNTTTPTIEVFPSGVQESLTAADLEQARQVQQAQSNANIPPSHRVSFEDEFVKLDSKVQTAILGSPELLKLFTQEPSLLREMTIDKMELVLSSLRSTVPPPSSSSAPPPAAAARPPAITDDRRAWGASTIRSSVRTQVMNSFPPNAPYGPPRGQHPLPGSMPYQFANQHPDGHHMQPPPNRFHPHHQPPHYPNRGPPGR